MATTGKNKKECACWCGDIQDEDGPLVNVCPSCGGDLHDEDEILLGMCNECRSSKNDDKNWEDF